MFNMGATELLVIFAVIMLLFGARRLPELAKGLGQGIMEFKRNLKEIEEPEQLKQQN
ncbi:MAG: twin-arginine translocase TatA/TatE family subunit [Calditrichaeota bacterium]|nr:MAG: twin-arginine translocase TatA/TatE family subunit [Calditrichota bacterium]